jgi:hypothetical protein
MPPSNLGKRRRERESVSLLLVAPENSGSPRADLDAHSDFQTDQVAAYDHSHVWSAQEAFALFPSVNSGSSGARHLANRICLQPYPQALHMGVAWH